MIYCGIDCGLIGAIVFIDESGHVLSSHIMPTYKVMTNKVLKSGKLKEVSYIDTDKLIDIFKGCGGATVYIEKLSAIHGIDSHSNFRLGEFYGTILGMMRAFGLDVALVSPKDWQKAVIKDHEKVIVIKDGKKKNDTKATALNAARRLFPGVSFLPTARSKKAHDGMVDAALIAWLAMTNERSNKCTT